MCHRTGKYTVCRRVHELFSLEILRAGAVNGVKATMWAELTWFSMLGFPPRRRLSSSWARLLRNTAVMIIGCTRQNSNNSDNDDNNGSDNDNDSYCQLNTDWALVSACHSVVLCQQT